MIGKRLGHYEILELLGKGGMGEVYRAHDSKLGREVAVKVLPEELARDPERLARFRREAQLLASVNHPNIAAIYGIENFDGRNVLIMELAEGEDLAARLERGPIPLAEALSIAVQMAEGLEEAHEKSIVHRDLKPANVMVHPEGRTKILDFGLARAYVGETMAEGDPALSPTVTAAMTQAGVILGSAAYMSPEQAKGRAVDRRTDIWAFGVILFEMITGQRLFRGETVSETMASVMKDPVPWDRLPDDLPPAIRALLERCLERDPRLRLRDIGEARIHLQNPETASVLSASQVASMGTAAPAHAGGNWWPWLLFAAAAMAAMYLGFSRHGSGSSPAQVLQVAIESPHDEGFHLGGANPAPATISPDGERVVFGGRSEQEGYSLWIKSLSNPEAMPIPGTAGAQYPFWSPDSQSIAFFARGALRIADLAERTSREIVRCQNGKGGCWLEDGTLLFTPTSGSPIAKVSVDGGEMTFVTNLDSEPKADSHRHPRALPDGEHFLFAARKSSTAEERPVAVMVGSLKGDPPRELLSADGQAEYANGRLLYVADGKLLARPFDPETLELGGSTSVVAEKAGLVPGAALALFSASENGRLVYHPGHQETLSIRLAWFDLDGKRQGHLGSPAGIGTFAISPDGRRVALSEYSNRYGTADLYLQDVQTGIATRLTFENEQESGAVWGPQGKVLYYVYGRDSHTQILRMLPDSPQAPEVVGSVVGLFQLCSITPDGRYISAVVQDTTTKRSADVIVDLENPEQSTPVDPSDDVQGMARFSPDGRWIAYTTDYDGKAELYLKSFPDSGRKWQLVDHGAAQFCWDPKGDRLLYQGNDDELWAVSVDLTGTAPRVLGSDRITDAFPVPTSILYMFQMHPDGSRILVTDAGETADVRPARLILNWPALISD